MDAYDDSGSLSARKSTSPLSQHAISSSKNSPSRGKAAKSGVASPVSPVASGVVTEREMPVGHGPVGSGLCGDSPHDSPDRKRDTKPWPSPLGEETSLQAFASRLKSSQFRKIVVLIGEGMSSVTGFPRLRDPLTGAYLQNPIPSPVNHSTDAGHMPALSPSTLFTTRGFKAKPNLFYKLLRRLYPPGTFQRGGNLTLNNHFPHLNLSKSSLNEIPRLRFILNYIYNLWHSRWWILSAL